MNPPDTEPVIDLYREVHKGLRLALFDVCTRAGALDPNDATGSDSFAARFAELDRMLTLHHAHEDEGALGSLIERFAPEHVESIEIGHLRSAERLATLRDVVTAHQLVGGRADEVYDSTVAFACDYLVHMEVEERGVMPALVRRVPFDELLAVEMSIRTSLAPADMAVFLRSMLPAMNVRERVTMLRGMKAAAPADVFDEFWEAAQSVLSEPDIAIVATRIDDSRATVPA